MLVENSSWIRYDDRWRDVKGKLESDKRYNRDVLSPDDREDLFEDFANKLKKEREASKYKKASEEEAQREREREARRLKEREERRLREQQEKLLRDAETTEFKVLLLEKVHDSHADWETARKSLERDRRFNTKILSSREKEHLYHDHMKTIVGVRYFFGKSIHQSDPDHVPGSGARF